MSHPGRATNEAANNEWREVLATIKEDILALVANKKDGVTADECSSVRTLGWTLADPLRGLTKTPISPGYSGPLAEARCEDELTKRLLCGAQVWDGATQYPVPVPEYDGLGYCKDGEGDAEAALMVMRRQPWVTLKPGEGIHEVFCKCAIKDGRAKCLNCVCKPYGKCSQLCNCRGICGNNGEGFTGGGGASPRSGGADDDNGDNELSDESNTDTSDSESETDEPLDANVQQGGFSLGFDEDNAREYAEDLAREEAGQGQEGGVRRV